MLKKLVKIALTVSMASVMATPAVADIKVGGKTAIYFGQFSTSEKTDARESDGSAAAAKAEASHFLGVGEGEFTITYTDGDITALVGLKKRTDEEVGIPLDKSVYVSWKVTDAVDIKAGRLVPLGANMAMSHNEGASYATAGAGIAFSGLTSRVEDNGLEVKYKINPYMYVAAGLLNEQPYYSSASPAVVEGFMTAATGGAIDYTGELDYEGSGSGMYVDFFGALSKQIIVAGAFVTGKADKFDGGPTSTDSGTALNFRYMFSDDFSVTAAMANSTRNIGTGYESAVGNADSNIVYSEMGLMIKKKGFGPGEIRFTYGTTTNKTTLFEKAAALKTEAETKYAVMDLLYDLPLGKGAGAEFRVIQRSVDEATVSGTFAAYLAGDSYTRQFVGLGLYAKF